MQYIRRRIQQVSGVIIRDERLESRDFSVQTWRTGWDSDLERRDRAQPDREMRPANHNGAGYRERT